MDFVWVFICVLLGCYILWTKVIPYVLDYFEDVYTFFARRRQRRFRKKVDMQSPTIFDLQSKEK